MRARAKQRPLTVGLLLKTANCSLHSLVRCTHNCRCAQPTSLWTVCEHRTITCCQQIERCASRALKAAASTAIGKAEALLDARTKAGSNWCRVGGIDYYVISPTDRTRL